MMAKHIIGMRRLNLGFRSMNKGDIMDSKEVSIILPVAGWNVVLAALGQRPYADVAALVEAIKMQAAQQLASPPVAEEAKAED
jgi:hypothetical protein